MPPQHKEPGGQSTLEEYFALQSRGSKANTISRKRPIPIMAIMGPKKRPIDNVARREMERKLAGAGESGQRLPVIDLSSAEVPSPPSFSFGARQAMNLRRIDREKQWGRPTTVQYADSRGTQSTAPAIAFALAARSPLPAQPPSLQAADGHSPYQRQYGQEIFSNHAQSLVYGAQTGNPYDYAQPQQWATHSPFQQDTVSEVGVPLHQVDDSNPPLPRALPAHAPMTPISAPPPTGLGQKSNSEDRPHASPNAPPNTADGSRGAAAPNPHVATANATLASKRNSSTPGRAGANKKTKTVSGWTNRSAKASSAYERANQQSLSPQDDPVTVNTLDSPPVFNQARKLIAADSLGEDAFGDDLDLTELEKVEQIAVQKKKSPPVAGPMPQRSESTPIAMYTRSMPQAPAHMADPAQMQALESDNAFLVEEKHDNPGRSDSEERCDQQHDSRRSSPNLNLAPFPLDLRSPSPETEPDGSLSARTEGDMPKNAAPAIVLEHFAAAEDVVAENDEFDIAHYMQQWQGDKFVPDQRYFPYGFGGTAPAQVTPVLASNKIIHGWTTSKLPSHSIFPRGTFDDCAEADGDCCVIKKADLFLQLVHSGAIVEVALAKYKHLVLACLPSQSGIQAFYLNRGGPSHRLFPSLESLSFVSSARNALMRISRSITHQVGRNIARGLDERENAERMREIERQVLFEVHQYFCYLSILGKPKSLCFDYDISTQHDPLLREGFKMLQEVWQTLQSVQIHCVLNCLPVILPGLLHSCYFNGDSFPFTAQGCGVPHLTALGARQARGFPDYTDELGWKEIDYAHFKSAVLSTENPSHYYRKPVYAEFANRCAEVIEQTQKLESQDQATRWILHCFPKCVHDHQQLMQRVGSLAKKFHKLNPSLSGPSRSAVISLQLREAECIVCPPCGWHSRAYRDDSLSYSPIKEGTSPHSPNSDATAIYSK